MFILTAAADCSIPASTNGNALHFAELSQELCSSKCKATQQSSISQLKALYRLCRGIHTALAYTMASVRSAVSATVDALRLPDPRTSLFTGLRQLSDVVLPIRNTPHG